jgi:hypothetical protein
MDDQCLDCADKSRWMDKDIEFDMTIDTCQDAVFQSLVSLAGVNYTQFTPAPSAPSAAPSLSVAPSLSNAPSISAEPSSTPTISPAPTVYEGLCEWKWDKYAQLDLCMAYSPASEQITLVADGECRSSGTNTVGYYRAICEARGTAPHQFEFLASGCSDANCAVCSNVLAATYRSNTCASVVDPFAVHFKSAIKMTGRCDKTTCLIREELTVP